MKKFSSILLALVVLVLSTFSVSATDKVKIFGQRMTGYAGCYLDVPIKIEKNSGLMGFKLTVSYSEDAFELDYVVPSNALDAANGIFKTSEYQKNIGCLDIVWNSTKNAVIEGELIILRLKIKDNAPLGGYTIGINSSSDDAFNEKWEKIELHCSDIIVNIVKKEEAPSIFTEPTVKELNKDEVDRVIEKSLRELGVKSLKELTEEEKEEFVSNAENRIKHVGGKAEIKEDMSADEKIDAILGLYPDDWDGKTPTVVYENEKLAQENKQKNINRNTAITLAVAFIVIVVGIISILIVKKQKCKRRDFNEESN